MAGRPDTWLAAALAGLGAVALGAAIQVRNGEGAPAAFAWLTVGVVAVLLAVVLPSRPAIEAVLARALPGLLVVALVGQLYALVRTVPAPPFGAVPGWQPVFAVAAVGAALAAGAAAWGRGRVRGAAVVAVLAVHLALGVWTIRLQPAPSPPIDVFVFQHDAVAALVAGVDPYAITFANPYRTGAYYGPGLAVGGRLLFGFPYPPLSLYLSTLGHGLGGDVRYAQLAAMTVAAALMATLRRGPVGALAAALYLFTPRNLFVLQQSWTEPFAVLFLVATVWCAARHPRAAPYVFGLFLAIKQYALLVLPLALVIGRVRGTVVRALLVAAAVTLPLAVWNVPAFVHSVVALHVAQPFRSESLSYLGLLAGPSRQLPFSPAVAFVAALAVEGLALWRAPRTPAGFALGMAAAFVLFFALNKQAFANYYFLVAGALCAAVAAAAPAPDERASPVISGPARASAR